MYSFKSSIAGQSFLRQPSCSVCYEPFDDKTHLPKILQCAHTICDTCVNLLEQQSRQTNRFPQDRNGISIRCPTCRTVTQVPRSYVRSNYQLIEVVDTMREEATHNISFMSCINCRGVYHEKDVNICAVCSPVKSDSSPEEVLQTGVHLEKFALCSTCILNKHIAIGHAHIPLQRLRVDMQRIENLRRLNVIQNNVCQMQKTLRENLDRATDKWFELNVLNDMTRFKAASNSFEQKKAFDEFVALLKSKSEHLEKLVEQVEQWNEELEHGETAAPAPAQPAASRVPSPAVPPAAPPALAIAVPEMADLAVPQNNYLYYFDNNIWDPRP